VVLGVRLISLQVVNGSVIVIGCHIINNEANFLLSRLINSISKVHFDYGIVANSNISSIHYKNSKFFLFDSENYKLDGTPSAKFWFENDRFKLESPFLFYGAIPNYSFGASSLFINSVILAKKYNYKFLHWLEYDLDLPLDEIDKNTKILNEQKYSSIVYETNSEGHPINGGFISLNLDMIDISKFYLNKTDRMEVLMKCGNSSEKFIKQHLLNPETTLHKSNKELNISNGFNQGNQNQTEFVFFEDSVNLCFFIKNNSSVVTEYVLYTNKTKEKKKIGPYSWGVVNLGDISNIDHVYYESNEKKLYIDLTNKEEVFKYIKCNVYQKK
jgi:hypothetical protein